jgi:NAD dependent epimerase/dehydratase family enzyme
LAGRISSGTQWISWIHVADYLSAVRFIREFAHPTFDAAIGELLGAVAS